MATTPYDDATAVALPRQRVVARPRRRGAPLAVAAVVAAGWAAILSYGLVLLLVALGALGSGVAPAGAARLALAAWLLGHGVPLDTPADRLALVPLALSAFITWRLMRAGVHASRAVGAHRERGPGRALGAAAAVAGVYATLGAGAAGLARTADLSASPWRTASTLGLGGLAAAGLGALRHSRSGRGLAQRVPAAVRDAVRTGVIVTAFTLAAGALAAGVALAVRGGDAATMLGSYRTGVLGQAGITLLCLAYAPNLAVWGAAYLLGPGFAVGADTAVSPTSVLLGPLPAVPPLAAVPTGPAGDLVPALLTAPVVAAAVAGWVLGRRWGVSWGGLLGRAVLTAPVAGGLLFGAAAASAGALGSGRLADLGPTAWRVGLAATLVTAAGAILGAILGRGLKRTATRAPGSRRRERVP